ncbi:hypothetical protein ACIAD2195 [Acinetobacter baylyi ADP1]|uniref:Uncharacterized protein n=2 Tax=Moraxellaceae TaxID=468 RepID=Q6FAB9_ACIAD|nr:hypothetical protein ACIAD2195 [Acinetobacter baylyi ADP1]
MRHTSKITNLQRYKNMNAKLPVLTITTEQLRKFERERDSIVFDVQSTSDILDQMSTLFSLIAKASEGENPSIYQIKNLARLGHYTCDGWSGVIESIESHIKEISPLNSTNI